MLECLNALMLEWGWRGFADILGLRMSRRFRILKNKTHPPTPSPQGEGEAAARTPLKCTGIIALMR